ncbi:hypothetical protein BGZ49_001033 [Haplosporangium sp. Z 27]|nr:hypothetical protein BGZ49_001033 [Haplosporangium sp. Z 27]
MAYLIIMEQHQKTVFKFRRRVEEADDIVNEDELHAFRKRLSQVLSEFCLLYEDHNYTLPRSKLEVWYFTNVWGTLLKMLSSGSEWLYSEPGDKCSTASSLSKNKDRNLEVRQASGHKVDYLLLCRKNETELGAIEAGRKDDGPTGTKALEDARESAKILKDMHNAITKKCAKPILKDLRVYGLLISGLRVEFVSMSYIDGRIYRFTREKTYSIPLTWDETGIHSMLRLINEMLLLRDRLEAMAKLIYNATNPGDDLLLEISNPTRNMRRSPSIVRTLSTQKPTKRSRHSIE